MIRHHVTPAELRAVAGVDPLFELGIEYGRREKGAWRAVLRRDPCSYCGNAGGTVEHLRRQVDGGSGDHGANIVGACSRCNDRRGDTSPLIWLVARRERR